jgi:ubiquinone/menaquinone biosynthesis C-methylase UbiE
LLEPAALTTAVASPASTFDEQALRYDARAGLPSEAAALVARAIMEQAAAHAGDLVVELGAGTGEIGAHLARLPVRYAGLDASAAMLDVFRAKAGSTVPSLIVADCDRPWPLPDGSATVVFGSRVIHLLRLDHVARETLRVCRPAGLLIIGRVLRDRDGIAERLRRRRLDLLLEAGFAPQHGDVGTRRVIDGCVALGAASLGRQIVAEWTVESTPGEILGDWASLARWGSVVVDGSTQAAMLEELWAWARSTFGDLDQPVVSSARYAIDVVRLP